MNPVERNRRARLRAMLSLPGHQQWETDFALWGYGTGPGATSAVYGGAFDPEGYAFEVEEIQKCFRQAAEPANWMLGPSHTPAELGRYLRRELHFMGPRYFPGMEAPLRERASDPDVSPLDLLALTADEYPGSWWVPKAKQQPRMEGQAQIEGVVLGLWAEGRCASSLVLFPFEETLGIYDFVTRDECRGSGYGTRLLRAALGWGFEQGYRVAVLQAAPKATALYERLGFRDTGTFTSFYFSRTRSEHEKKTRG